MLSFSVFALDWNAQKSPNYLTVQGNGFEVIYDAQTFKFAYPLDVGLEREVSIRNVSTDILAMEWFIAVKGPDNFSVRGNAFPQGAAMYLNPNESKKVFAKIDWGEIGIGQKLVNEPKYDFNVRFDVFPKDQKEKLISALTTNEISIISKSPGFQIENSSENNYVQPNAWVSGYIRDKLTNQIIQGVNVFASNQYFSRSVTDSTGYYKLPLFAYYRVARNAYFEVNVRVEEQNYGVYNKAIVPKPNENINLDIYLDKPIDEIANYSLVARYDTNLLHLHKGANSKDGTYFALVPFHSVGVTQDQISDNAYVWFFDKNGSLLWKYKIGTQSSTVDVSDDGNYVAAVIQTGILSSTDSTPASAILLDKKGNLLWKFFPDREKIVPYEQLSSFSNKNPMETRISHNNKYYAVGCDDGSLFLLDLNTGETVWKRYLDGGQIRYMEFDEDDLTVYASEGEGYLYAYNIDGTLKWKTYVHSFALDMAVSKNFIFIGGKVGHFVTLVDKKTGKVLWEYPVDMVPDRIIISPDESLFYASIANGGVTMGAAFFNRDGNLLYILPAGNPATMSSDSKYMVVVSRQDNGLGNDTGVPFIKLIDVLGNTLWSSVMKDDLTANHPAHKQYSWISDDKKQLIVAAFQYVYFFEGGIKNYSNQTIESNNRENDGGDSMQQINTNSNNNPMSNSQDDKNRSPYPKCENFFAFFFNLFSALFGNMICN